MIERLIHTCACPSDGVDGRPGTVKPHVCTMGSAMVAVDDVVVERKKGIDCRLREGYKYSNDSLPRSNSPVALRLSVMRTGSRTLLGSSDSLKLFLCVQR
jgi:hypothetical protein